MTSDTYFPRSRSFWLYHGSAMAAGLAMTVFMIVTTKSAMVGSQLAASLAWMPFYTLAVLTFRWLFKWYNGAALPMGRLIVVVILYSVLAGMLIGLALQVTVWPFFWDEVAARYPGQLRSAMFGRMVDDFATSQLFVAVWAFIYVAVTSMRRVRDTEVSNLKLANALKDAQLSSLSNQLNPHFLFNALNNIRFMMYESTSNADSMITALSEILRYSLDSSRHEKIALGQELAIIDRFVDLVGIQLEDRLRFDKDIDSGLHAMLVPPMVLQMLVENAVKHGLEPLKQGGTLRLAVTSGEGRLHIDVSNDTPPGPSQAADGMGIGLRNIAQRLQLLYGEQARIDVEREPARFNARLTLPMETA